MRLTSWLLVFVALALLGALGGVLLSSRHGEPRELLESALDRIDGPEPDYQVALEELNFALRSAQAERDRELVADILTARGAVLVALDALGPARADLELVLEKYRPNDLDVELQLAAIDEQAGELEDALARTSSVVERDPSQTEAWTLRGAILMQLSEDRLEQVKSHCRAGLADEDSARASGLAERAVGMDLADPLRVSLVHGVRSLFEPPDQLLAREVMRLVDEASDQTTLARTSLVQSFAGELDSEALLGYLRILRRANRSQDAIDFGLAAVTQRAANSHPLFMETLAQVLISAGRPQAAADVIQQRLPRTAAPGQTFYAVWADALYSNERWKELLLISTQLRNAGDETHRSFASFYSGVGLYHQKKYEPALTMLDAYLHRAPVEPHPGAEAEAWRAIAGTARAIGNLAREREARLAAVRLDPLGDGEDWLRLYQILQEDEPGAHEQIESYLTRAMCLLPHRVAELTPAWIDIGKRRLKASGTELELVIADLRNEGRAVPQTGAGPYELMRLAEHYHIAGETVAANSACDRVLSLYPGFLPALDLKAEVAKTSQDHRRAAELWLERLRRVPGDSHTLRRLERLPEGTLDHQQLQALMRLDPENRGRLEVARTLVGEGRPHAALAGLTSLSLAPLGDDGRLLAAQLMVEVGRYDDALATLARMEAGTREQAEALSLSIDAAMKLGDPARLSQVLSEIEQVTVWPVLSSLDQEPDPSRALLANADQLLLRGYVDEAKRLLRALDAREELRSGAVLMRLAGAGLLTRDITLAQDSLERAEAFEAPGPPELGRLLLALENRNWSRLPLLVRALIDTGTKTTRVQSVVLSILDERTDEARRLIEEGLRRESRDPVWRLLLASLDPARAEGSALDEAFGPENRAETLQTLGGDGPPDPRPLYARLLALESPEWRVWALAELLRAKPPAPGSLWASFFAAGGFSDMGQPIEAERLLRLVNRSFPTFVPAWNQIEALKLKRVKRYDHEDMVGLREERRKALGRRPGEEAEELLTEAWSVEALGRLPEALALARRAVEEDPALVPALYKLGQLEARLGDWIAATDAYHRAAALAEVTSASPIVEEFVQMLWAARRVAPALISASMIYSEVEELSRRFPEDPLVALAFARAELSNEEVSSAVGVARAYERLDRFRTRSSGKALELLRPGSTRQWKDLYQSLEPLRAEEFVRRELELRPGSIDQWLMLGETFETQERRREAIELYELVQRMVPDGKTRRAIASLLASSGADPERVEQNITEACRLEGRQTPDVDLQFTLARALLNGNSDQRTRGIEILASLWSHRELAKGGVNEVDIAQLYGTALVQRADPRDRQLAYDLLHEMAPRITDNARQNLVEALSYLALQIPAKTRP